MLRRGGVLCHETFDRIGAEASTAGTGEVDTYGHLVPGGNKAAVDRLDDAPAASIRTLAGRG